MFGVVINICFVTNWVVLIYSFSGQCGVGHEQKKKKKIEWMVDFLWLNYNKYTNELKNKNILLEKASYLVTYRILF